MEKDKAETERAEIERARREKREAAVARGDTDDIAIDQEVANAGDIGREAETDTGLESLARTGRTEDLEVKASREKNGDIEAEVRTEAGPDQNARNAEGVRGPGGADHQKDQDEVDRLEPGTTGEGEARNMNDDLDIRFGLSDGVWRP